jgi:hypothetical protein
LLIFAMGDKEVAEADIDKVISIPDELEMKL